MDFQFHFQIVFGDLLIVGQEAEVEKEEEGAEEHDVDDEYARKPY